MTVVLWAISKHMTAAMTRQPGAAELQHMLLCCMHQLLQAVAGALQRWYDLTFISSAIPASSQQSITLKVRSTCLRQYSMLKK